ncbi:GAF domain-containing protein [Catenovulum maritimum]|uniref:GAF domain-containing protein n=1 Tax=Catenovulum maritimum TaxID=1513271 RepID=A0A0J8JLI0_9ALTE|nr:GAF domain-containing protein [Catenovulum maritimum]KMT65421.1 hypothetical protein XM47_08665 [Catenovulum maritimum]
MSIKHLLSQLRLELNMETAILAQISDNQYKIEDISSTMDIFNPGDTFDLTQTYCEAVIQSQKLVTYTNVGKIQKMRLHPVYTLLQLESYIGYPIIINDQVWGTLNLSSTDIRGSEFTLAEIEKVKNTAVQITRELT